MVNNNNNLKINFIENIKSVQNLPQKKTFCNCPFVFIVKKNHKKIEKKLNITLKIICAVSALEIKKMPYLQSKDYKTVNYSDSCFKDNYK